MAPEFFLVMVIAGDIGPASRMSGDRARSAHHLLFPGAKVKLVRKGTPERKQAILDYVEVLRRD
ncbi:hypothetical protein HFO74_00780 [Rhizobium laguerreae]|uniref:Uncharacterized protein n=1 Tax=Rhizobium laguerreae TaxID=1076926 RepID=A0AB35F6X9_9HYPH|nr:hypothetical protein [Rhizobium laguerreae]MBY3061982.1 hypothetical protein [Rhizobium laguerreae]MBY3077637.1 hypothetical protein [Rhizobium laguerreae]MBY3110813.1 hypothetical protein [Rhizobium laguerreae]MBY3242272.1 hypothetical protein [Rhizobium laguerreae]MBY3301666.1 hypothetical protein [Rhizobium laguerreae]